ncbi:MAG: hypothetical protein AMS19_00900 [Gemmatimonas sp. SG8_23]|nr:MAG: hypothetical protein AMS19_00900 [Gemmatimonas sp. SG8_23]
MVGPRQSLVDDRGRFFRRTKDEHEVDRLGDLVERSEGRAPKKPLRVRIDRNHVEALGRQVGRHTPSGLLEVAREADHRDVPHCVEERDQRFRRRVFTIRGRREKASELPVPVHGGRQ